MPSGYRGGRLAPWFKDGPTTRLCRAVTGAGASRLHEHVTILTPVSVRLVGGGRSEIGGALKASWRTGPVARRASWFGYPVYEAEVRTDKEYADYVENGTGIYHSPDPHTEWKVTPKRPGGWLRWIDQETGEPVFAKEVTIRGMRPHHMMARAAALTEGEVRFIAWPHVSAWRAEVENQNRTGIVL